jgi:glycosyltransferase involved in cell wall biosynthesis
VKIAVVCSTILAQPHGGIPSVNRQILRQLERIAAARGEPLEVRAWALHDAPRAPEEAARAIGLPRTARPSSSFSFSFRGFSGSRVAMMAAAASARRDADVILTTHLGLSPVSRLLRGPSARLYQLIHGVECWRALPLRARLSLAGASAFLSNSAFTHRRFLQHNPAYQGVPSRVCWLGAPDDHVPEDVPEGARSGDLSVLIVGRIMGEERYKGHEQLLAVWPEVRRRFPTARLDIVGDGNASAALRRDAERRGLAQSGAVKLWGQVPDDVLRDRYRSCSVFAMPSRGEGFGLVYVEAMAFGKPCLASLDDAAPEVVLNEETGLLVRYADREGILHALCRLLESQSLRARLGRAGRARVLSTFTERHFGDRLWRALELDLGGERRAEAPAQAP